MFRDRFGLKRFIALAVAIVACLGLWIGVATAANNSDRTATAEVVADGRVLFQVGSVEDYPARDRATYLNQILAQKIAGNETVEVKIVDRDGQMTLRAGDRHLLTVTRQDIRLPPGFQGEEEVKDAIEKQAIDWRNRLQTALDTAAQQRRPEYIKRAILLSFLTLGIAIGLHGWAFAVRRYFSRRHRHGRLFWGLFPFAIWGSAIAYMTALFPLLRRSRYWLLQQVQTALTSPLFRLGDRDCSVVDVLVLLALLAGIWMAIGAFANALKTRFLNFTGVDRSTRDTVSLLVRYTLLFIGSIIVLQTWGINTSAIAVTLGTLGVGIGFGLQNIASNFISGIILGFARPIKVGDFVQVGDLLGTVEHIGARSTEIITLDRVSIIVPNSQFLDNEVINWSHGNPVSRIGIPIGVSYQSDVREVRKVLLETVRNHPDVLHYPAPQIWLQEFGDSSINFDIFVWIRDPKKQFKLKSDLNYRISINLKKYKIEIPFPQRDLNVRSPHIDDLVSFWTQRYTDEKPQLYLPKKRDRVPIPIHPIELETDLPPEEIDIEAIAKQMRGSTGVEIKDRRFGLTVYPRCFVGMEAVSWLMETQKAGEKAAVQIGQMMVDRGIVRHVLDEHSFKNERLFYRFLADELP